MEVIPSIDLTDGRSRIVSWPGASTGRRPDRPTGTIVERFAADGARVVHRRRRWRPGRRSTNLESVGRIAATIAVPISWPAAWAARSHPPRFAAGAAVCGMEVVDDPERLRECLAVGGDWLAVGLDPRPERLAAFAWHRPMPASIDGFVTSSRSPAWHGRPLPRRWCRRRRSRRPLTAMAWKILVGRHRDTAGIMRRDAEVDGVILGELVGAISYPAALKAAA
jgi:hypothetical protein